MTKNFVYIDQESATSSNSSEAEDHHQELAIAQGWPSLGRQGTDAKQSFPMVNIETNSEHEHPIAMTQPSRVTPPLESSSVLTEVGRVVVDSADHRRTGCGEAVVLASCTQATKEASDDSTTLEVHEPACRDESPGVGNSSDCSKNITGNRLNNQGDEEKNEKIPRRSRRDINRIRLQGTAPTFYRRLQILFSSSEGDDYKHLSNKRLQLIKECSDPPIYVVDNFLTDNELAYFHAKTKSIQFEKSFVDNMDYNNDEDNMGADCKGDGECEKSGNSSNVEKKKRAKRQRRTLIDSSHRTSTFFAFGKRQDSRIAALESRVADLLGCWVGQIEAIQLVRYVAGQFFGVHHDMGDLLEDDQVTLPPKDVYAKRRLVTLFVYLNSLEDDQGGCTHFPYCGLRVRPKKGRAVLWSNVTTDGLPDPRTIHAGEPVKPSSTTRRVTRSTKPQQKQADVVKYGLNIWICEE